MFTSSRWIRRWRLFPLWMIVLIFSVGSTLRAGSDCGLESCADSDCDAVFEGCGTVLSGCALLLTGMPDCSSSCGRSSTTAKSDAATKKYVRYMLAEPAKALWIGKIVTLAPQANSANEVVSQPWQYFQQGLLSAAQLQDALETIRTGTWQESALQQSCREQFSAQSLCYRSGGRLERLSADSSRWPVPSVFAEHPIALYLKQDSENEQQWQGRVDSQRTPHLPGFPVAALRFQTHPASSARVFLSDASINSVLGGRYALSASRENAQLPCHGSFIQRVVPWFPHNTRESVADTKIQASWSTRKECYQRNLPMSAEQYGEDTLNPNVVINQANPLSNGQMLLRTIQVYDGVLLNDRTLLMFFRETTWPTVSPDPKPWEGWMLLQRHDSPAAQLKAEHFVGNAAPSVTLCKHRDECPVEQMCVQGHCQLPLVQQTPVPATWDEILSHIRKGDNAWKQAESPVESLEIRHTFAFPGDQLEPRGVAWVGESGLRLYHWYRVQQSYQMALDSFWNTVRSKTNTALQDPKHPKILKSVLRAFDRKMQSSLHLVQEYQTLHQYELSCQLAKTAYLTAFIERMAWYELLTPQKEILGDEFRRISDHTNHSVLTDLQKQVLLCQQDDQRKNNTNNPKASSHRREGE